MYNTHMEYVYTGHRLLITLQWGFLKIRIVIITDSTEACSTKIAIWVNWVNIIDTVCLLIFPYIAVMHDDFCTRDESF